MDHQFGLTKLMGILFQSRSERLGPCVDGPGKSNTAKHSHIFVLLPPIEINWLKNLKNSAYFSSRKHSTPCHPAGHFVNISKSILFNIQFLCVDCLRGSWNDNTELLDDLSSRWNFGQSSWRNKLKYCFEWYESRVRAWTTLNVEDNFLFLRSRKYFWGLSLI